MNSTGVQVIISVNKFSDVTNKVVAIKSTRMLSGLNLIEAKELVERAMSNQPEVIHVHPGALPNVREGTDGLKAAGFKVSIVTSNDPRRLAIRDGLNELVSYATVSSQTDLVMEMRRIVELYFPKFEEEQEETPSQKSDL